MNEPLKAVSIALDGEKPWGPRQNLLASEWLKLDLPPRDYLMEPVFSTTSRWLIYAPTGVGKTMFAMNLAAAISSGTDFLSWQSRRKARVMYLDGELPAETFRDRIRQVTDVYGTDIDLYGYNRDNLGNDEMPPLNTGAGQDWLWAEIEQVKPDLIVFDSIMCLTGGDMREETSWEPVKPLIRKLSSRRIAQIWLHHTGHNETRSYGSKTKEWELDTVLSLTRPEGDDDAVVLNFTKARLRTPESREHFAECCIRLGPDGWYCGSLPPAPRKVGTDRQTIAAAIRDSLMELQLSVPSPNHMDGAGKPIRAVNWDAVREDIVRRGYFEMKSSGGLHGNDRQTLGRAKRDLLQSGQIIEDKGMVWLVTEEGP